MPLDARLGLDESVRTILALLRDRKEDGLRLFLAQYGDDILGSLEAYFGRQHSDACFTALQRTTYFLWTKHQEFDPEKSPFDSWIKMVAFDRARNEVRTEKRKWFFAQYTDLQSALLSRSDEKDDRCMAPMHPMVTAFLERIDQLPAQQRDVIKADLFGGNTYETDAELAKRLGTTKRSLQGSRCKGRKTLISFLNEWLTKNAKKPTGVKDGI